MSSPYDLSLQMSVIELKHLIFEGDRKFDRYFDEISPIIGKRFKIDLSMLSHYTFEAAYRQSPLRKAASIDGVGNTVIGEFRGYFLEYNLDGVLLGLARPEKYLKATMWQSVMVLEGVNE